MKTTLLVLVALTGAAVAAQQDTPRPPTVLTPAQTLDRRAVGDRAAGDLAFSPDGSRLVFTVAEPVKGTTRARAIWMLDVAGDALRQLTFSGKNDTAPRWAPDGSAIAFVSDRDGGAPQLYLLPMRGGEAEKLTDRKEGVGAYRWSPDGTRIALLMAEPKSASLQQRERDKDDGRVVDKDDRRPRIWILDVASRTLEQVTSGQWKIAEIAWTPDGAQLIAIASARPEADAWTDRLYAIDLPDGRFAEIAAPRGPIGELAVSPDGRTIAYIGARVDGPGGHDLYLQPVAGGAPRAVAATTLDRPVGQPRWIDNQTLAVTVARGFKSAIAIVGAAGRVETLDGLDVNPSLFARAANGTFALVGDTTTRAPEVWIKPAGAAARVVTRFNQQWTSIPLAAPRWVTYKSADGTDIEAALLLPEGAVSPARSGQPVTTTQPRWPAVVLVHGGPTGRWSDTFEPWGQLLAARGYAVLYPNVRGSTAYGHRFVEMNRGDWGGGDFKDVMAGVDWLVARGLADPDRLGIGGWSYGGYMAAWAVTQTNRFKAAVSGAPVIDIASEFGTEDDSSYDEWFYGTPYEQLDGFIKSSPITHVRNVKTPTLLLQGDSDVTDPIGQSQQFYRGLKRYGVDSDFVVYPREPHGLREEKHLLDRLNRILGWYDKHLSPAADATGPRPAPLPPF